MATTKKTSVRKPAARKPAKVSAVSKPTAEMIELRRTAFEILGRYFPYNSGKDSPALRAAFRLPANGSLGNAQWKKGACDYLAENLG